MLVEAIPTTDFVHGAIVARAGRVRLMEEGLARDLEQAGLLRIRPIGGVIAGPFAGHPPGNVPAAGAARTSSASPAAPASPATTAPASKPGARPTRLFGKSSR